MVAIGYSVEALSLAEIGTPLTLSPAAITSVTYTMPASTLPSSTWVSTDFTSAWRVTGLTLIPAFLNTSAATTPHGTCGWHSATLADFFARSCTEVTFPGFFGGVATSMVFLAKVCGLDASPALTTESMFAGAAEANTSAGAPLVIWVARPELGPKLNFTVSPGWAASNCFPSWVKVPISEAAAKTVIVPDDAAEGELLALGDELPDPLPLLEQPATATAASPAAITAKRRIVIPLVQNLASPDQLVSAIPAQPLRTVRTRPPASHPAILPRGSLTVPTQAGALPNCNIGLARRIPSPRANVPTGLSPFFLHRPACRARNDRTHAGLLPRRGRGA